MLAIRIVSPSSPTSAPTHTVRPYGNYIGSTFATNWTAANDYCMSTYGTTLATITSADENDDVISAGVAGYDAGDESGPYGDRFFIGFNDIDNDSTWTWIDGSTSSYRYTLEIGGDGNCAEYIENDKWNDLSCGSERYFVCNYNVTGPSSRMYMYANVQPSNVCKQDALEVLSLYLDFAHKAHPI